MRRDKVAFLVPLLRSAGALVVGWPGALPRVQLAVPPGGTSFGSRDPAAAAVRPTTSAVAPQPQSGCSREAPTASIASCAQGFWRLPKAAAARHSRSSLGAALVSRPAVEGTADSSSSGGGGRGRGAGAGADGGGVVLIEQEGPAWTEIVWDKGKEQFVEAHSLLDRSNSQRVKGAVGSLQLLLQHWFIPEDVTPDYYHFTFWRMFQRFVAGTINVFGTQALLLALGIKARRLGAAAAMSWVLKDALGKFGRILWASKMGRRFDSDAKRWRFRSSLLYAAGNGLEIVTYVFPASFLILAAMANSFKQMSMLTSSATRNTIYRSFARGENIGDITAKGEAQIAVVDLLGMLSGIGLCTLVGTSRQTIVAAYVLLSLIDISAIYFEIRAVCFSVLNHERSHLLARDYVASGSDPRAMVQTPVAPRRRGFFSASSPSSSPSSSAASSAPAGEALASRLPTITVGDVAPAPVVAGGGSGAGDGGDGGGGNVAALSAGESGTSVQQPARRAATEAARGAPAVAANNGEAAASTAERAALTIEEKEEAGKGLLSSPSTVSRRENIFLSSRLTTDAFKTWSQAGVSMKEVEDLLRIFKDERYMLAYTDKSKKRKRATETSSSSSSSSSSSGGDGGGAIKTNSGSGGGRGALAKGIVSVILHRDATGADTVKSLLALEYLQDELKKAGFEVVGAPAQRSPPATTSTARTGDDGANTAAKAKPINGDTGGAVTVAAAAAAAPGVIPPPGDEDRGKESSSPPPLSTVGVEGGLGARAVPVQHTDEGGGGAGEAMRRQPTPAELRSCLEAARRRANDGAPGFFAALEALGWSTEKFMFGNIKSRVEWRQ